MDHTRFFNKVAQCKRPAYHNVESHVQASSILLGDGMPNVETYPFEKLTMRLKDGTECIIQDLELKEILQYLPPQGYPPLIKELRKMQKNWHSPPRDDWDVVVVGGALDGISKSFNILIDSGDPVMCQIPSYCTMLTMLNSLTPDFIAIEQDVDGIIPEKIAKVCEERRQLGRPMPKLLYVNPNGNNPTGTILPNKRKRQVYELAQKYDFLILEDDAYFFLHFLDEQPSSFLSLDTDGRVVRFDSFSKIISTGIRLGLVTAHGDLLQKLIDHTDNSMIHVSSLPQIFMCKLLENWGLEKLDDYLDGTRSFYRQQRDVTMTIMEKYFTGLAEWTEPKGGMFLWIRIIVMDDVLEMTTNKCIANGVFVLPGHIFKYDFTASDQHIRVCYSHATPKEIDTGLSILARLIREDVATKKSTVTSFEQFEQRDR